MGSENAKVRVGIYIEKAILEQVDGLLETANVEPFRIVRTVWPGWTLR